MQGSGFDEQLSDQKRCLLAALLADQLGKTLAEESCRKNNSAAGEVANCGDANFMLRKISLAIAVAASLPIMAFAAPVHGKRHIVHPWHGYGFLPGYQQPPNNSVPIYASKGSIHGTPDFAPSYWYGGGWYYFGEPGFSHGRWNGGSYGPCWTHTPIGLMWNCG